MTKLLTSISLCLLFFACTTEQQQSVNVVTTDIDNFWLAYDQITATTDTSLQRHLLDSLFLQRGTPGLDAIRQVRNYTSDEYLEVIKAYPRFWASIRANTMRTDELAEQLEGGIDKLRQLYPELRPAKVYFTMGAFRTNGTTLDSLVLIGSEQALADSTAVTDEFPEAERDARRTFFDSNPIENLVLLNVHEFVHTQQKPMVHNLLCQSLYEGVAEFVSVKAMGVPSAAPAIPYGYSNEDEVRARFEHEMYYVANRPKWLWSNAPNRFGVRDLGYFIGYRMCELYCEKATDKQAAIKELIEFDYADDDALEAFVDGTGFFSAPLAELYQQFEDKRPTVAHLSPFANQSEEVNPGITHITVHFSEALNGHNTGVDYGPLGADYFPNLSRTDRVWSEDGQSWTVGVELEPNRHYQFSVDNNFRTADDMPLKPFVIEFKTGDGN